MTDTERAEEIKDIGAAESAETADTAAIPKAEENAESIAAAGTTPDAGMDKKKILRIGCMAAIVILLVLIAFIVRAMVRNYYASTDVSANANEATIERLERFTELKSVDFSGSTDYALIMQYEAEHPDIYVTYDMQIGDISCDNHTDELEFEAGSFEYDELMEKLRYLPALKLLKLPETDLNGEQMTALREAYPNIKLEYSFTLFGEYVDSGTTALDMSDMSMDELPELAAAVQLLPELESIELMKNNGSTDFSMTDVKKVMDACPGATVKYSFELFGQKLTTETERAEYSRLMLTDEDAAYIREALDIMPACTYFLLDDCGISDEVMASIRDAYPDTKVVWRVFFGYYNCLTDTEVIRATHDLTDAISGKLNYCTDVVYLDVGHNDNLHDVSFVANMPKLKVAILGCALHDIEALRDHPSIEFLELCYRSITDVSPLENCSTLKYLNISFTFVSDLTPIWNLPLERFVCTGTQVLSSQLKQYAEDHPDCLCVFEGAQPFGYGWRYSDYGFTYWDYYANLREVFRYDERSYYTGAEYTRVRR